MTVLARDTVAGIALALHARRSRTGSQVNHFVVMSSEINRGRFDFRYVGQDGKMANYCFQAARHGLMAAEAAERDTVA